MRTYTAEEFAELALGDNPCELVRGVVEVRGIPYPAHAYTAGRIAYAIHEYLDTHPIGVMLGRIAYITERDPDTVRTPDVSFIRHNQLRDMTPDLAAEVLSESDSPDDMATRITEYFANGARLVWVADPAQRTVAVHAPDAVPYVVGRLEILDGGDVLPGFRVSVNTFFGWPPRSVPRDTVPPHDLE